MVKRKNKSQTEHDCVIASENSRNSLFCRVHTNPGQIKNKGINGQYPDVIKDCGILVKRRTIKEIETEDSINKSSIPQWKSYAKLPADEFILSVPKGYKEKTIELLRRNKEFELLSRMKIREHQKCK